MTIHAPRQHVWSFFEDFKKLKQWVPGFVEIRVTSPPDVTQGATYIMTTEERGRRDEVRGRNLVWERGRRIREEMRSGRLGPGVLVADHRFTDLRDGRTRFDYEHVYVVTGWRRLLAPVYWLGGRAYCRSMFATLKARAEARDASLL